MSLLDFSVYYTYIKEQYIQPIQTHKNELARKSVHISLSLACIGVGYMISLEFGVLLGLLTLGIFMVLDNTRVVSYLKNVSRVSYGHYFLIIGILFSFILYKYYNTAEYFQFYSYSLLVLGFGDGLAVAGKYFSLSNLSNSKYLSWLKFGFNNKTLFGFLVVFSISILASFISIFTITPITPFQLVKVCLIAYIVAAIEFVSSYGSDNLFIPSVSMILLYLYW